METNSEVSTVWSWPEMTEPLSFAELDYGASSSLVQDLAMEPRRSWSRSFELAGSRKGEGIWFIGGCLDEIEAGGGGTTSSGFSGGCVLVISGEVLVVSRRFTGDGAVGFWLDEEDGMKVIAVRRLEASGGCGVRQKRNWKTGFTGCGSSLL
ncbi:hypothetical protein KY290_036757 [Solanum tuberosum]|uniref:Uncharacterized protein n=1 Tax=Solanum tuberosum TaxID=4113 RepID=A0ABQ7TTL8_SOLTU|nr:hypothetical protein KY290_036757 [Solanum tuberosum]